MFVFHSCVAVTTDQRVHASNNDCTIVRPDTKFPSSHPWREPR